jgi:hypothetical protein
MNVVDFLEKCFSAKGMFYFHSHAIDFIIACLSKNVATRPDFTGLKNTQLYKNYSNMANGDIVKAIEYDLKLVGVFIELFKIYVVLLK